jgi:ankyrin repeat protein
MEINNEIFDLIKNKKFNDLYKLIKDDKIIDYDIKDVNYNYLLQLIVLYNLEDILKLIYEKVKNNKINIRLDIIDIDGRSILFNCIKYNYINLMKILIEINKIDIGISILDIIDLKGLSCLHYCIILNNIDALKLLLDNNADPYQLSKDNKNIFIFALEYKRNDILKYLLNQKYNINLLNSDGENLLQMAVMYENYSIANLLLDKNININNINSNGNNVLYHIISKKDEGNNYMLRYDLFTKILDFNINYNNIDFFGYTPLHYIMIENSEEDIKRVSKGVSEGANYKFLEILLKKKDLKFNLTNINGDIPLHILLENGDIDLDNNIMKTLLIESDLNIMNNKGITCLMLLINKYEKYIDKYRDILVIKPLNFFLEDNEGNVITMTDKLIEIATESYYNMIKIKGKELVLDWELWCYKDVSDKLKKLTDVSGKNNEEICKNKIKNVIKNEKRSLPRLSHMNLKFDNGIFTNGLYYIGQTIDILYGLLLLNNEFSNQGLSVVLNYPLNKNDNITNYYKKLGLDYSFKLEFSNIEILWSFQKLFFPTYFDSEINIIIKKSKYIVIPLGIETSNGSHANILFWDINNHTIERFEPNGSNYPLGLNYNPTYLDTLLKNKFIQFDSKIKYLTPYDFLPTIGFQILENLETEKCRMIGDPDGFCGVWCIWWVYTKMLNIKNINCNINYATLLINNIKNTNTSFKKLIRNFSFKITKLRDMELEKHKIDINDWIAGTFDENIVDNIEKNILKTLHKL